jgi:acyl-CoA synthetase (AMP-forming)/AMP-acid ligase II
VGGFNAYPAEIEAMLRGHPGVAAVAVIGVPDDRLGEVGCAYVVPAGPEGAGPDAAGAEALARELLAWSRDQMANYKVPRGVVVVESLPVNAGGKVLKRELRARHRAGHDHVVSYERSG